MSFFKHLSISLKNPEFWTYSAWLDIIIRYRRTRMGLVWLIAPPMAYVLGVGHLYSAMMSKPPHEYIVHLGIGYVLWRLAIQVTNDSTSVLTSHKAYIMDGRIHLTDFVLRAMTKALFNFAFAFLIVLVVIAMDPDTRWVNLLSMLVTLPIFFLNLFWLAVVLALLGARFPDTKELVGTTLVFGFLFTPILWFASAMPIGTLRGTVARFNPAFHLIEMVRAPVMGHMPEVTSLYVVAAMTVLGWWLAIYLYNRYARYVPLWI